MVNQNNSPSDMGKIPLSDDKNLMNIAQYLKGVQQSHKRSIPPLEQWHPKQSAQEGQMVQLQPLAVDVET
ncbi:DUF1285 domain-containing protein, partial [Acinetobacter baumannii]